MIKITFDCEDAELAAYLSLLYDIYTKEDMDMSLGLLRSQLAPALQYLFNKLTDLHIEKGNKITDSSNQLFSNFNEQDWSFLCKILDLE